MEGVFFQFLQIIIPIVIGWGLGWLTTRHRFYANLYYTEGIEFIKKYHLPLLTTLQIVIFNIRTILGHSVKVDINVQNTNLELSLKALEKTLDEYVKNAGHVILKEIDTELSKELLRTQATRDLWSHGELPYDESSGSITFNPKRIQTLYSKLSKVPLNSITEGFKNIVSDKKSKNSENPSPELYNYAYIDSTNVDKLVKNMGWQLDAFKFRVYLKDKYNIKKAFQVIGELDKYEGLYKLLKKAGFEIIFAPIIKLPHSSVAVDIDSTFSYHILADMDNYDRALIVSGDGSHLPLVEHLIGKRKLLKLMIPNENNFPFPYRKIEITEYFVSMNRLEEKLKR